VAVATSWVGSGDGSTWTSVCALESRLLQLAANLPVMTEQADGARYSDVDTQRDIGKIEVVVLRCDYDDIPAVEPRAQAAQAAGPVAKTLVRAASGKAPSGKIPSGKAPSSKAPSAKPASAASAGLGGLFGLFDGACDRDLDGTSDDYSACAANAQCTKSEWNAIDGRHELITQYSSDQDDASGQAITSPDQAVDEYFLPPFGLDGHDYEYRTIILQARGRQGRLATMDMRMLRHLSTLHHGRFL
jgi:hypothetical protein